MGRSRSAATRGFASARARELLCSPTRATAALEMAMHADRPRAGRRSDHALVHLRLHRERRRPRVARRRSSSTSATDTLNLDERARRAGDHTAHEGDPACPLRGSRVRDGELASSGRAARPPARRGRGAGRRRVVPADALGSFRRTRCAQLPRDKERHVRRGRRPARERRALRRAGRDCSTRRARIAAASFEVRSTSTPGSTLAPRILLERAQRRVPLGAARAGRRRSPRARLAIWSRYHAAFEASRPRAPSPARRPRGRSAQRAHVLPAAPDLETRTAFIARLASARVHAVFHYVPLHVLAGGRRTARPAGSSR